ncbi:hypothetical protein C0995_004455 [Termitomyces sp. Mi166|nr:hypothetical protein C0995_004455 [Termitomyces sp. Mi166\
METEDGEIVDSMEHREFSKEELASKSCEKKEQKTLSAYLNGQLSHILDDLEKLLVHGKSLESEANVEETAQVFSEKYKLVAKVKPVLGTALEEFRIERCITGDALADMPKLDPNPPEFKSTGRYTTECKEIIEQAYGDDFLWPEEMKAVHHLMMLQNKAFAWYDSQDGRLKKEFFPPVVMPVIPHTL